MLPQSLEDWTPVFLVFLLSPVRVWPAATPLCLTSVVGQRHSMGEFESLCLEQGKNRKIMPTRAAATRECEGMADEAIPPSSVGWLP